MYSDSTDVHISLVLSLYGEFTFYMRLSCLWTVSPSSVSGHAVPASGAGRGGGGCTEARRSPAPPSIPPPAPLCLKAKRCPASAGLGWAQLHPATSSTSSSWTQRPRPGLHHTPATDHFPFIRYRIVPGAWSLDKQGPQTSIISDVYIYFDWKIG